MKKVAATITFEDGTQEFGGGEYDTVRAKHLFAPSAENANKKVKQVDIKPLEANGPHMLTISEINFLEGGSDRRRSSRCVRTRGCPGEGEVSPQDDRYPYFTVESDQPTEGFPVRRRRQADVVRPR